MAKSTDAFRNIREASEELDVPQHVLRFWETKFPEIQPLKRGGRRRYYRPEDLALLTTIRDLLYVQGYTIRGVQRLLREGGIEAPPAPSETLALPPEMEAEDQRAAEQEAAEEAAAAAAGQARPWAGGWIHRLQGCDRATCLHRSALPGSRMVFRSPLASPSTRCGPGDRGTSRCCGTHWMHRAGSRLVRPLPQRW